MSRKKKKKSKNRFYLLVIKSQLGLIDEIISHSDYDILLLEGQERAKKIIGFWEIFDTYGRYIDGNIK